VKLSFFSSFVVAVLSVVPFLSAVTAGEPVERNVLLPPSKGNPRNSEAAMIDLADGRVMLVYSHFTGGRGDHAKANLAARFSSDGGATWSKDDVFVTRDEGGMNTMSPSLLRMKDGSIGLFYLRKNDLANCVIYLRRSADEGKTWGEPELCSRPVGYYVMNNDRAVRLKDGRILLPVALHATPEQPKWRHDAIILCFLSDDDGKTWTRGGEVPAPPNTQALEEPGVVELKDGRVMLWIRTSTGKQFVSYSPDRGQTWTESAPSNITSPRSPASIERIPSTGDLLLAWNNNGDVSTKTHGKRTPFNVAISRDDGKTWENVKTLESDPDGWHCYTAIHFAGDHVILSHCADNLKRGKTLATTQVTRFPVKWLYEESIRSLPLPAKRRG
jgi:sialidase-1